MKAILSQLMQWPPTATTVIGIGLIVGAVDYWLAGNVVEALFIAGLFKVLCPQDAAITDRLTATLDRFSGGPAALLAVAVVGALGLTACGVDKPNTVGATTATSDAAAGTASSVQSSLQKFAVADLQAADADAKAHNDTVAATCYEALIPVVQNQTSPLSSSAPKGAATAFQQARDIAAGVQSVPGVVKGLNVPCAPLVLDAEQTLIALGLKIAPTALPLPAALP